MNRFCLGWLVATISLIVASLLPVAAIAESTLSLHWPAGTSDKGLCPMAVKSCPIKIGQPWPRTQEWPQVYVKEFPKTQPVVATTRLKYLGFLVECDKVIKESELLKSHFPEFDGKGPFGPNRYPPQPVGDFDPSI
jgi:hypothetical protein